MSRELSGKIDVVRRQLYRVLARRALQWDSGTAAIEWACDALCRGWDCPPLAILAGLEKPPNEFEVDRYLRQALTDLGIGWPEKEELLRLYAVAVAEDILTGALSPKAGCMELSKLCSSTGYPRRLMDFYSAEDELDLAEAGTYGSVEEVMQRILTAARCMVEAEPGLR